MTLLYLYGQAAPFPGSGCGPAAMRRRGSGRSARDGVWRCGGSDNAAQGAVRSMGEGCRKTPPAAVLFCGGAGIKCPGRLGGAAQGQAHREPALFCTAGKGRRERADGKETAGKKNLSELWRIIRYSLHFTYATHFRFSFIVSHSRARFSSPTKLLCGVRSTFSISHSGLLSGRGSSSKTSSTA